MVTRASLQAAGVTAREAEVLTCLAARLTNAEIGERLFISVRTVESHVAALLRKLDEPDRRRLAARAHALAGAGAGASADAGGPATTLAPAVRTAAEGPPFVGRVEQLDRLEQLGARSRSGGARYLALVTGEAGIGKSRLAAEAALRLHAAGADVIHGRCADDALVPYEAIGEAIRPILGAADDPFARPAEPAPGATTPDDRYRLFEDVDGVLASRTVPLVLVLDDVQWIDPSGLRLLGHLARHLHRSPLLVIATGRPEVTDPLSALAPVLAAADAANALEVVDLDGLSADEARTLATHLGRHEPDSTLAAWERSGGNPFLLTELFRHAGKGTSLPPTARDAIVRRVAGLGPASFEALVAAAVAGEAFRLDDVVSMRGGDRRAVTGGIERAFTAGLVVADAGRGDAYRFAHAIVREALVAVTSPSQRCGLHLRLAAALEERGHGVVADIARHRHAALPGGDVDRAREACLAAYDDATRRLAFEVAAEFAEMALDATDAGDGERYAEGVLRRGRARLRAGELQRSRDDFRDAFRVAPTGPTSTLAAEALLGWADASPIWGRDPGLRGALRTLLARGVDDDALRPRLTAKLAQVLYYEADPRQRLGLCREAVADARSSGRDDVLASVLATTHAAMWGPVALDERIAMAREAVATARVSHQPDLELQGLGWLVTDLLEAGDLDGTDRALADHAALAEGLHHRLGRRDVELWSAMRAMLDGRFDDAAPAIERARDLGEAARDPAADTTYWVQRYWLAVERCDPAELDELVEPCERIVADNLDVPAWSAALAMLHTRRGDADAARDEFERLARDGFAGIPRDVVWLTTMTYLAETCAFLGDTRRAPLLVRALVPYADRTALIDRALACKGAIERFLGLLAATVGDHDEAERRLRRSLARHRAMHARPLVERTRRDIDRLARR